MSSKRIELGPDDTGKRLDLVLVERVTDVGRSDARRLFGEGRVLVIEASGKRRRGRKGDLGCRGDVLEVRVNRHELQRCALPDSDAPLRVLFQDDHAVVIDKPAGQPSAPLRAVERGCAANALLARFPEMESVGYDPREPGLCHRLDVDTSGVLLAARSQVSFERLTSGLRAGALSKRYLLVCGSKGLDDSGSVELPVAPHPGDRRRMMVCKSADMGRHKGHPAKTHYRVVERKGERALVEVSVPCAQRHQIRVHFAAIGHPLLGDRLYGGSSESPRHALHASAMSWKGDALIAPFVVTSPLPPDMCALIGR